MNIEKCLVGENTLTSLKPFDLSFTSDSQILIKFLEIGLSCPNLDRATAIFEPMTFDPNFEKYNVKFDLRVPKNRT